MYDRSRSRVGITGFKHDSIAEADASFWMAPLGIVPCQATYPMSFTDSEGATFTARADFQHTASGVWFEFKASNLNDKPTKAAAAKAEAKLKRDEALGFLSPRNRQWKMLQTQWSHSVHKQAAVVAALTPAKVVLVLKREPSEQEVTKLAKGGIFWRTRKTLPAFALYLKLASQGLAVGFSASAAHPDEGPDAGPWHAFGLAAQG